jgi:hypothetical protein
MGSLTLPTTGPVYADAQIFIYSVEKHPIYALGRVDPVAGRIPVAAGVTRPCHRRQHGP